MAKNYTQLLSGGFKNTEQSPADSAASRQQPQLKGIFRAQAHSCIGIWLGAISKSDLYEPSPELRTSLAIAKE